MRAETYDVTAVYRAGVESAYIALLCSTDWRMATGGQESTRSHPVPT